MKNRTQLTLLLSCILMLCSHSINAVGNLDVWNTGHTIEERFSDLDNQDIDNTSSKTIFFTASKSIIEQPFFFEKNLKKIRLTHGVIRAPPTFNNS